MEKFFKDYQCLADKWILFNNSGSKPEIIAKKQNAHIDAVNGVLFEEISKKAGVKL